MLVGVVARANISSSIVRNMSEKFPLHPNTVTAGFTLVELMVAFSLGITISLVGMLGFSQFSDKQQVESATLNVATMLQKARSRARSQVKPGVGSCATQAMDGYQVRFCDVAGSGCTTPGQYELLIVCGGLGTVVETKQLPQNIFVTSSTLPSYQFNVITGAAQSGQIIINGNGIDKTITISSNGTIN